MLLSEHFTSNFASSIRFGERNEFEIKLCQQFLMGNRQVLLLHNEVLNMCALIDYTKK